MSVEPRPVRRALISVSNKEGLASFGEALVARGIEILSTGGTQRALAEAGLRVREVADYTGFPEMMDGRVKTLHPRVHGGILGRRGIDDDAMAAQGIEAIDMVVVNLYPFRDTVARDDCTRELAVENIDIGGPAMVRAAAKNHEHVVVVVDPADYAEILEALSSNDNVVPLAVRQHLAVKAFQHTARYDTAVAAYLAGLEGEAFPAQLTIGFERSAEMRYGENPHQAAALYVDPEGVPSGTIAGARQLQGKALSYNNVADTDAALECVKVFAEPACVIVKHANPCGAAMAEDIRGAYEKAYATDPTSAFGGIIAFNRPLDAGTLEAIVERQFVEVVVAPDVDEEAIDVATRRKNLRLLTCGAFTANGRGIEMKRVGGGLLVQKPDELGLVDEQLEVVTERAPSNEEMADLLFAWKVAWFVKSNAIVYAKERQTVGVGAGQMSRVVSARIAAMKAEAEGLEVAGAVMASDAFFPFRDSIDAAAEAGVTAVVQPGGSVRDEEVVAAANEHGLAMVFTGIRHFRH